MAWNFIDIKKSTQVSEVNGDGYAVTIWWVGTQVLSSEVQRSVCGVKSRWRRLMVTFCAAVIYDILWSGINCFINNHEFSPDTQNINGSSFPGMITDR